MFSLLSVLYPDGHQSCQSAEKLFLIVCNFCALFCVIIGVKNDDTFSELVFRYRGLIYAICRRYGRRWQDEDDLMQEVLLALWLKRDKLLSISSSHRQAGWIWRVARNVCIDQTRRSEPTEAMPEGYDAADDAPIELHRQLHELIALLPEPDRTIIAMHLEGYEYREIGKRLGMSKNNVGVRLMRIKERLRKEFKV